MEEDNLLILAPEELPKLTNEEIEALGGKVKKEKPRINCLQDMVIELMNERGLKDADIIKAIGIPWSTWHGWVSGDVRCQMADDNLKKLMKFFNVHLEYLVYGIGDDSPAFEEEKKEEKTG